MSRLKQQEKSTPAISPHHRALFQHKVWRYYYTHHRSLPWRHTRDPYHILVSEVMLQQTRVVRVIEKYQMFLAAFPSIRKLACASLRDVLTIWSGLGYNRRALLLKRAAEEINSVHGGTLPREKEKLEQLPGIGSYTAEALRVFAWNKPAILLETNIRSVFIHEFFPRNTCVADKNILPLVECTLDENNSREWYFALMDYGAFLKKENRDLNKQSKHYVRQSTFEGSDRQMRGEIIKALTQDKQLTARTLAQTRRVKLSRMQQQLENLLQDGLIKRHRDSYSLPE